MQTDSRDRSSIPDCDGDGVVLHETRSSWIPRAELPRALGVARHWSLRRREKAYGRLSRLAILAGTQH